MRWNAVIVAVASLSLVGFGHLAPIAQTTRLSPAHRARTVSVRVLASDPRVCTPDPMSYAEIQTAAAAAGTAAGASPSQEPTELSADRLPQGEPADQTTIASVTAVVEEAVTCANANQPLRLFRLFSPRFLRENLNLSELTEGAYATAAAAGPTPGSTAEATVLVGVRGVRKLDNDRVGALVTVSGGAEGERTVFWILVPSGERWLIDGYIRLAGPPATAPAG